jgi:hypothetical protein
VPRTSSARRSSGRRPPPGLPAPTGGLKGNAAWLGAAAMALAALVVVALVRAGGGGDGGGASDGRPVTGPDLHSLVVDPATPGRLFVGGHQRVATSDDRGARWSDVVSLRDADAMGWAFEGDSVWVSGHPGLNRSTDGGRTFRRTNEGLPDTDVHAFGAGDAVLYGASPAVGLFASEDGGRSWTVRTAQDGRGFFGRILVDAADTDHLVAADAQLGPVESSDGGRSWRRLGGLSAATWVSGAVGGSLPLIASSPAGAARSTDGGRSWEPIDVPDGTSIVEGDPRDPDRWYAGAHDGAAVSVFVTTNGGRSWERTDGDAR